MPSNEGPLAVGIDLGTTYSCIAYIDEFGKPVVLKNFEGNPTTPSVVCIGENNEVIVGLEAKRRKPFEPDRVIDFIKRYMGEPNQERIVGEATYRPEEISSYILKKVVADAEAMLGRKITQAIITCPAYFGINKREATAQAGVLAGLKGFREDDDKPNIIPEPTAAAFYYGLQRAGGDEVVMVYDLGGGTFDVTLLEVKSGSVEAICIGGDHELGGKDWDDDVTNHCLAEARDQGAEVGDSERDMVYADCSLRVEEAKRSLSARDNTTIPLTLGGTNLRIELSRDKFEELTRARLERTITLTRDMLRDAAAKGVTAFDRILLVGGSTKMPQVKRRLMEEFPGIPIEFNEPDESVAKGAALFAQKLLVDKKIADRVFELKGTAGAAEKAQEEVAAELGLPPEKVKAMNETTVTNCASKSFGLVVLKSEETGEEAISNLIIKNTALPVAVTRTFSTVVDNQSNADLRIMESLLVDEMIPMGEDHPEIGHAVLSLDPGLPKGSPIEVTFELDEVGLLKFHGRDPRSNKEIDGEVKTEAVMTEEELEKAKRRVQSIKVT